MRNPPGARTRLSSARARTSSRTCSITSAHTTASKLRSGNGIASHDACLSSSVGSRSRPAATSSGSSSIPTAYVARRAYTLVASPRAHPASSSLPGLLGNQLSISQALSRSSRRRTPTGAGTNRSYQPDPGGPSSHRPAACTVGFRADASLGNGRICGCFVSDSPDGNRTLRLVARSLRLVASRDLAQVDRRVIQLGVDALLEGDLAQGPPGGGRLLDDGGPLVVADRAVEGGGHGERAAR